VIHDWEDAAMGANGSKADDAASKLPGPPVNPPAGCTRHREELTLVALQKKLANKSLSPEERDRISAEVARLERELGF
jgi:hypothetical protein